MENLYEENVNTSVVDNLVSGTLAQSKVAPVKVTGTGLIKRGTPLFSEDGETFSAWGPAAAQPIMAILLADVDASDPDSNVGSGAFGGEFNQNVIETVMKIGLGELDPAAILAARARQIFIAPMNPAPEAY